jgi:hypothetical protein
MEHMSRSSSLGSRWWAGFTLLVVSGFALAVAFTPVDSAIQWLSRETGIFEAWAFGLLGFTVIAVAVLCPLILAVLCDDRALAEISSLWVRGLRFGVVCLLAILPWIVAQRIFMLVGRIDGVNLGSQAGRWLQLLVWSVCLLFVPFWVSMVFRRLPQRMLGRGILAQLSERFFGLPSDDVEPGPS